MTNAEFKKLLTEIFESHTLMKNRDYHTVNELLHVLRYDEKLSDLERVNINVIKSDGNCLCVPHLEAFVDVKTLGVWFEDIAVEFEIEEFEVDDEMLKFSNITVYEREVI